MDSPKSSCPVHEDFLSGGSFPRPLTEQGAQHNLALARQGDLEVRNILIERNLRLVAHVMKKYYAQASDQDDLISSGPIKGISSFNPTKGAPALPDGPIRAYVQQRRTLITELHTA